MGLEKGRFGAGIYTLTIHVNGAREKERGRAPEGAMGGWPWHGARAAIRLRLI